ncbi:VWA domain-containing protein [Leucobacter denitrificans]|uniref:VWA domain-containing protein n=1 Tax=Leucobacter denitrificans TaxID=683042 RepID=A0A7G9S554_9MICO|nr:VWA domain-containing protein [Leucobacter denitrificans]QNN62979.1 VWA domain-containing protein [Leucobacter denitrificans]
MATSDLIDASYALEVVDLADRESVRESLAACLIKSNAYRDAYDLLFDLFFTAGASGSDPALSRLPDEELRDFLVLSLQHQNHHVVRQISAELIDRHAKIVPGRAVAGTIYIMRAQRAVRADELVTDLLRLENRSLEDGVGRIALRAAEERARKAAFDFERILQSEVRRRLVEDRGADAVASTLRNPLPEDVDFLTASGEAIHNMEQVVEPLGRALGFALATTQQSHTPRFLDIRTTIRRSISTGGAPVDLRFRPSRPPKPKLVVLADISGSVASFASFALQLTYALRSHFASIRSFVFVDGLSEVTDLIATTSTIVETTRRINDERRGYGVDGHSDYGNALRLFSENHHSAIDARTTVLILGDARNNYRDPHVDALDMIRQRAASVYFLNPEAKSMWNEGDSVASEYATHCTGAFECRTIRQLEHFVSAFA